MGDATASVREPAILIRPPRDTREMRFGVDLQQQVWGYAEIDTVPDQMFIVARESGGQVLFPFDQEKPAGFALAFAAIDEGTIYLHSHMVGVMPGYQNRGVGRLLKLAQRDDAIARGTKLIEWTFDPLQLRNAHFNLMRAWCSCPSLHSELVCPDIKSVAWRLADRPLSGGMVDSVNQSGRHSERQERHRRVKRSSHFPALEDSINLSSRRICTPIRRRPLGGRIRT
jgi:GNAT superfamily N-acetyltransferase